MLTERQLLILRAIIDDYIQTAQPVGSRTLSKRDDLSFSSATIRNDMADLEDMGLIEKPHTSAGRIPSEVGYRYYVDHLVEKRIIDERETFRLEERLKESAKESELLIRQAADLLSDLTNYTTVALGPNSQMEKLARVDFMPIDERRGVVLIVTDQGHVEHRTVVFESRVAPDIIEETIRLLNDRLVGTPLGQLKIRIGEEVAKLQLAQRQQYDNMMQLIQSTVGIQTPSSLYLGGKKNIFNQPEFQTIDTLRPFLEWIDEQERLTHWLESLPNREIYVSIGSENGIVALQNCSVITSDYTLDGKTFGTIAMIGPTRMNYRHGVQMMGQIIEALRRTKLEE
ncbi:heat-inducible transcriptional repressor HrcA [Exiguobacterium algae]|uniref:heat-inducible transcriptional repressor HrcA n=1 Tax=Exiguobacterium algae TaxID=2751250 RepID=UPI001BEC4B2E